MNLKLEQKPKVQWQYPIHTLLLISGRKIFRRIHKTTNLI